MIAPNTVLRDRYRIIHQLGHGGMGAVYQAMDENLSCLVAVKETFAANDEQRRAFRREAELLANLSHPNLPRVTDHFTDSEGQFLVMQFVPGHDLAELLELREQPFPVAKVLDWADQILDALEELHSSSPPIIHRDIKPANLKVTPKGRVWLLDFGLAKGAAGQMSTVDEESRGKSIYGYTANYAPIEQIRGAGTDPRSDLYSLAATMWTLLTTAAPPDALSRLAEKEEGNPDPLRPAQELNSQVPNAVSSALERAMAVNRNQRYATAAELRDALREARDAKFESPTQPMVYVPAAAPSKPRPLEPTVRAPERVPPPPARQPAGPTIKSPQRDVMKPAVSMPTMRVDAPPSVPTQEGKVATPTSAPLPIEGRAQRRSRTRVAMIAAAVLVVAIVAAGLAVWRPWSSAKNPSARAAGLTKEDNLELIEDIPNEQPTPTNPTRSSNIEFVRIYPGSFMMGSTEFGADERPVHQVTINYSFYIGKYEVTQAQWQSVMGDNPSDFKDCANCPVEQVSWDDTQKFTQRLNGMNDGYTYRLPTEAEWEYACRAGTPGDDAGNFGETAWYSENSRKKTHAIGGKQPNAWGLANMHGNVSEWCQDWYHGTYYDAPTDGSAWLSGGEMEYRVLRGGSWYNQATSLRSADRSNHVSPGSRSNDIGFRLVAVVRTP